MAAGKIKYDKNNFINLIREILYKKRVIAVAAVIGAIILLFINFCVVPPVYGSTAKLYIVNREENNVPKDANLNISKMLTRDYTEILRSNHILEKVIRELHLNIDSTQLKNSITINTPKGTRMLEICVTNQEPELSMNIINTLILISQEEFVNVSSGAKMNVLEYGSLPSDYEKPDILRIVMLGACYGSLMSILLIIRFSKRDKRIVTADDVEYWLGLSTLGEIPLEKEREKEAWTSRIELNTG